MFEVDFYVEKGINEVREEIERRLVMKPTVVEFKDTVIIFHPRAIIKLRNGYDGSATDVFVYADMGIIPSILSICEGSKCEAITIKPLNTCECAEK